MENTKPVPELYQPLLTPYEALNLLASIRTKMVKHYQLWAMEQDAKTPETNKTYSMLKEAKQATFKDCLARLNRALQQSEEEILAKIFNKNPTLIKKTLKR